MGEPAERNPERRLFLRRSLADPLRVAALRPSPPELAELVARHVPAPDGRHVLELGAGTGAVTEALARRIPEELLILVEIDPVLCGYLVSRFPRARVICGDVAELARLVEIEKGQVSATVSGLPVTGMSLASQRALVDQCFGLSGEDAVFLQYSFMPFAPLRSRQLGLEGRRVGHSTGQLPPLFVWRFTRAGSRREAS